LQKQGTQTCRKITSESQDPATCLHSLLTLAINSVLKRCGLSSQSQQAVVASDIWMKRHQLGRLGIFDDFQSGN
jgi:hypothetical protein